jgi:hypothetical protein
MLSHQFLVLTFLIGRLNLERQPSLMALTPSLFINMVVRLITLSPSQITIVPFTSPTGTTKHLKLKPNGQLLPPLVQSQSKCFFKTTQFNKFVTMPTGLTLATLTFQWLMSLNTCALKFAQDSTQILTKPKKKSMRTIVYS